MHKIKYLLLGLLTPLFCGFVFAFDLTDDEVSYLNQNALNQWSFSNVVSYLLYDVWSVPDTKDNYCFIFSWFNDNWSINFTYTINTVDNVNTNYFSSPRNSWATQPYNMICLNFGWRYIKLLAPDSNHHYYTDYFWTIKADKIIDWHLWIDVDWLLNDLSQCDTSVQQCLIDKESLSWSLASCNADKVSLQNYNNSLSDQLNQCLESSTSWDYASWLFLNYNLFWSDSDTMFSLPITNNLFLPTWYKWKIDDDNVLSIAKLNNLESAYMFSDDDKVNIIDLLSMVMLFLLATWSLIWLIVFLKRLVIKK